MVDVVVGCVGNLVDKIGEELIVEPSRHLGYMLYYKNYVASLKKELNKLMVKSQGMKLEVEDARRNGDIVAPEVVLWFASVDIICEESRRFLEDEVQENKGWFPNVKKRYILSKYAKMKTKKAASLKAEVFHKISYPAPPLAVGDRSIGDFRNFESRVPTINQLMKLIKDDTIKIVSIFGMGGSGKTTMVKEVARRVQGEKLFDEIIMAVVSKEHDLMKVQEDLAQWLGLRFKSFTLEGRANELWRRLLQSKKGNLVILDDVWKYIDLKSIGIPFGKEYNNCKVALTSRSEDVCKAMGCEHVLVLDRLTPSDAWSLMEHIVGDRLQHDPDLCETASEIAKRCGGLPIAIVRLGTVLKYKSKEVWNDTLLKLQRSIVPTNIGYEKEESNVGYEKEESNVGYVKEESNVGDVKEESNVGDVKEESNIGDVKEETNIGDVKEESNVGDVKEEVYESVQKKYDLWEDEEAKKLFLLTYRVYIENLKMAGLKH